MAVGAYVEVLLPVEGTRTPVTQFILPAFLLDEAKPV